MMSEYLRTVSAQRFTSIWSTRSEEHTSELQSQSNLVCRLLLEKKKKINHTNVIPMTNLPLPHISLITVPSCFSRPKTIVNTTAATCVFSCRTTHAANLNVHVYR